MPLIAGCSSSSPAGFGASNPQTAAVPPPDAAVAAQPAYSAPAATAPAAQSDYADSLPYPKQSLAELFRGSTETQTQSQTVPRPPSTYTPTQQPYAPQAQSTYGTPAASTSAVATAPPASPDPADSLPYPKQSVFDIFTSK